MEYCPYCGTRLTETSWGNKWCPNCGKVEEKIEEQEDDYKVYKGYIG